MVGKGLFISAKIRMSIIKKKRVKQLLNLKGMNKEERKIALTMFDREGEFLARLNHPGLPKISDKFSIDGRCYIVIDFCVWRQPGNTYAGQTRNIYRRASCTYSAPTLQYPGLYAFTKTSNCIPRFKTREYNSNRKWSSKIDRLWYRSKL